MGSSKLIECLIVFRLASQATENAVGPQGRYSQDIPKKDYLTMTCFYGDIADL